MAVEANANLILVVAAFLKGLNVPFTKGHLKQSLVTDPYYPSLFCISRVLKSYKIESKGLQVKSDKINRLPLPFIAFVENKKLGSKDFVSVTMVTNDAVTFYNGKEITTTKEDFIASWQSNIVLVAETTKNSKERDFAKNKKEVIRKRNKIYLLASGYGLILIFGIFNFLFESKSIIRSLDLLFFTLLGLSASLLLLVYEIDKSNPLVRNICEGGRNASCDAILESRFANIFGISWSEIGFFFFSLLTLIILMPGISLIERMSYITCIAVVSASYIPFSLFYQYKVAKQWCRLCMFVQGVLFLNLCWALFFGNFTLIFKETSLLFFVGCAIFPVLVWYTLKPIILKAMDSEKFFFAYKRLYNRHDIFSLTLSDQPDAPDGWQNLGVHMGNPKAENIIIKVCSPTCPPCITSYALFDEIIAHNTNVRLVILYNVFSDEADKNRLPVMHFLALGELGSDFQSKAMNAWYLGKKNSYTDLSSDFPVSQDLLQSQVGKLTSMSNWCKNAGVEYTPTVFFNGKKLSEKFDLNDLVDILL